MPTLIDLIAIAVAAVVSGGLSVLWYSPALLGPRWIAELGKSTHELKPSATALGGICGGWPE